MPATILRRSPVTVYCVRIKRQCKECNSYFCSKWTSESSSETNIDIRKRKSLYKIRPSRYLTTSNLLRQHTHYRLRQHQLTNSTRHYHQKHKKNYPDTTHNCRCFCRYRFHNCQCRRSRRPNSYRRKCSRRKHRRRKRNYRPCKKRRPNKKMTIKTHYTLNAGFYNAIRSSSAEQSSVHDCTSWGQGFIINDRYTVVSTLGEGTFGRVVKVNDLKEGGTKALKIIDNELSDYEDAIMEVKIHQKLIELDPKSKHLCVKMLDWFDFHGNICLAFEVLGLNIYDFLKMNDFAPYPLDDVRHIIYQLCYSVKFLHDNKLTHTDLKPENIVFVDSTYDVIQDNVTKENYKKIRRTDVRLIDFGSAVLEDDDHTKIVTTRNYRAPEVILKLGWSYSCDIWSIGCILFELYTGSTLFQVSNNVQHLAMMERVLGPIPLEAMRRVKSKYFSRGRLKWNMRATDIRWIKLSSKPLTQYKNFDSEEHNQLFDLTARMLKYVPHTRVSLGEALRHPFFSELQPCQRLGDFCAGGDD